MSTSPSWFDQEKFSRLVKKVGPKAAPSGSLPSPLGRTASLRPPEKETRRLQRSLEGDGRPAAPEEAPAVPPTVSSSRPRTAPLPGFDAPIRATPSDSTEEVNTPGSSFPPAMPLPEPRSVSPLSRRTSPLPNLKPFFEYDKTGDRPGSQSQPLPGRPTLTRPLAPPLEETEENPPSPEDPVDSFQEDQSFSAEAGATQESEAAWPAFQFPAKKESEDSDSHEAEDADELRKERDEARAEADQLRTQLRQADEILRAAENPGANLGELTRTTEERDGARRDYAKLRDQFETLKREQTRSSGGTSLTGTEVPASEESRGLQTRIDNLENMIESLRKESTSFEQQLVQSRDETSVAQRGLALSQKALQETRDALRELSESSSQARASAEALKNECASLTQRNLVLQSENEEISRELSSARAKIAAQS